MSDIAMEASSREDKVNYLLRPLYWALRIEGYTLIFTLFFWAEGKVSQDFLFLHLLGGSLICFGFLSWGAKRVWNVTQIR